MSLKNYILAGFLAVTPVGSWLADNGNYRSNIKVPYSTGDFSRKEARYTEGSGKIELAHGDVDHPFPSWPEPEKPKPKKCCCSCGCGESEPKPPKDPPFPPRGPIEPIYMEQEKLEHDHERNRYEHLQGERDHCEYSMPVPSDLPPEFNPCPTSPLPIYPENIDWPEQPKNPKRDYITINDQSMEIALVQRDGTYRRYITDLNIREPIAMTIPTSYPAIDPENPQPKDPCPTRPRIKDQEFIIARGGWEDAVDIDIYNPLQWTPKP